MVCIRHHLTNWRNTMKKYAITDPAELAKLAYHRGYSEGAHQHQKAVKMLCDKLTKMG